MSSYYSSDLRKDVNRAEKILSSFVVPGKSADIQKLIPPSILAKAHGIMFIRLYRVGLLLSAKGGTGIIIARLPDGTWSAPSGISLTSVGFGHLAGGEVIDSIIVMNYRAAVKAFFDAGGQIQLGMGVSVAAGPLGRSASVAASASNKNHIAATYAYSSSKGLFVGYSFEGSKISERHNTNASFYGRQISAQEILTGAVPPPQMAAGLYNLLNSIGASGQQPGITFGPNNRYSAPPLPPHPQLQQKQHSYPPPMSSHSPTLSNVPTSMASSSSPTVTSPVSPSTTMAYPNEKNPQNHQFYNNQQPSSYNNQQQTTYNNQQPSFNENQPSYHRASLQPSLSIRHPPQLNPNHPTTTADVEYIDPPPPYEPRKNEPTNNNNNNSNNNNNNNNNVSAINNITNSSPVNNNMNNNNHNNMNVNMTSNNYNNTANNNTNNNNTNNNVQNTNSSPVFQQQQKPPVISQNYPSHSLPPQQLPTNSPSLIHLNSPALSTNAPSTAPLSSAPATGTYTNNNSNPYINNNNNNGNGNGNTITVVAKYDFTAQQAGDLSFKVGDHITVTQWSGDKQSWWFGFIGHHSGQFPANFVEQIN